MRFPVAALVDLVLPATCAGCGTTGCGMVCQLCRRDLEAALPYLTVPCPRREGLPVTAALAPYAGSLRRAILAYKERGRHTVAKVLGERLAEVIVRGLSSVVSGGVVSGGVIVIPVPATAAAVRSRRGDHMARLATVAVAALRRRGIPASVAMPLRAMPRQDSAGMSAALRRAAAGAAFRPRGRQIVAARRALEDGAVAVLIDDIVTTGATLASAAMTLRHAGLPVTCAAVLAATLRRSHAGPAPCRPSGEDDYPAGADLPRKA